MTYDLIIIGAGPSGLACALDAQRRGLRYLLIEKGTVVDAIVRFPTNMTFFSTTEKLELADKPFTSPNVRPTRAEAIEYYQGIARKAELALRLGERVLGVERFGAEDLTVVTDRGERRARFVVLATGYFDHTNRLDVPGENLPKVHHYYHEPYPYFDRDVLVIGGRNSAAETALDLYRHSARVTVVHRGAGLSSVKYWIRTDIDNRIAEEAIRALWHTTVESIDERSVVVRNMITGERETIANDAVFAMIGYRPDAELFDACGIAYDPETLIPIYDPETHETSVPGLFIAGSVACGCKTWEIFIENGREHAKHVLAEIARRMASEGE